MSDSAGTPDRGLDNPLLLADSIDNITWGLLRSDNGPLATVENLLQLPHVEPQVWKRLKDVFARFGRDENPSPKFREAKGAVGFALMTKALETAAADEQWRAEPAGEAPDSDAADERRREQLVAEADEYFADPDVAATVVRVYGIPSRYDFEEATIHTVGTTSFIVKCPKGSYRGETPAVKCLLYRYFFVPSITESTARYKTEYDNKTSHAPDVWDSTSLFVAMSFEPGGTLATHLAELDIHRSGDPKDVLDLLRRLSEALCSVLAELYAQKVAHLDLSTSNIIVRSPISADPLDLSLIDFGQNYLVSERVGSGATVERAAVYVAPEVRDHKPSSWRADAYSLGVILLEVATGRPLHAEDLLPALEHLWIDAPGLARTLEDLLDRNPDYRLTLLSDEELKTPFEALGARLREELRVVRSFVTRTKTPGREATLRGKRLFRALGEWQAVREIANELTEGADENYRHFGTLANWAALSLFLWYVTLASFAILTLADLHLYGLQPWEHHLLHATHARFTIGRFWHNLPGRLIPLTFALTAVTYYNNIFAPITTRAIPGRTARLSEVFMRSTTFGLYIAILWSMLWAPQAWPLCSGIGTMLVVFNNYFVWRLALQAEAADRKANFSTVTDASERFIKDFREWFVLMGAYSGFITLLGVLLLTHVAKDEAIYAYIICFINVFKMYRLNCVDKAPMARGGFERVLTTLRRAQGLSRA